MPHSRKLKMTKRLRAAAHAFAAELGITLKKTRASDGSKSRVFTYEIKGEVRTLAIRTSTDRWIAFPPMDSGRSFQTLDLVDDLLVAVVDDRDDPQAIEVALCRASDVRSHFRANYDAHAREGHALPDGYGIWVSWDERPQTSASNAGSNIAKTALKKTTYPFGAVSGSPEQDNDDFAAAEEPEVANAPRSLPLGLADSMLVMRGHLAAKAGVPIEWVKITIQPD